MILIFSISFWLYFLLFFIATFIAFFIPGDLALRKLKLPAFQRLVLGTVIGMVIWGLQGVLFGYLGLRWLTYVYLLIAFVFWANLFLRHKPSIFKEIRSKKPDMLLLVLIVVGSLIQLTIVWFNGVLYSNELYFCCGNTSDNLFHIALTNQIVKHFPPFQPGMSEVIVKNYHYWSNLVIAELIRVFHLPLIATQYQYSTLFISIFLGLSALVFSQLVKLGKFFALWLIFFLYFGGDLIYLLFFALGKGLNFNISSLEDGAKFLVNPPRAFSIVVFFVGISLLVLWIRKRDLHTGLLMALVLGSVIGFKVYSGIFALIGLGALGLYFLAKRNFRMLVPLIVALVISLAVYLPVNSNAGGLYFTRFWLFENFIVQKALGLKRLELARVIFEEHHNWIRFFQYELIFFSLYVFSVFGPKLLGLVQSRKSLSLLPREINIFLISGIIVSAAAGFFFQQTSGGANTFNFLVSIFIIGSIYTALACYYWIGKIDKRFAWIAVVIIILLTAPRVLYEWQTSTTRLLKHEGLVISNLELQSLNYLREKTDKTALVLVDYRGFDKDFYSPYVSFLADRPMFLSGKGILESHGIETSERERVVDDILTNKDAVAANNTLLSNNIKYIYMSDEDTLLIEKYPRFVKIVFRNKDVKILKVVSY